MDKLQVYFPVKMWEYPMSKDRVHIQTIIRETERKNVYMWIILTSTDTWYWKVSLEEQNVEFPELASKFVEYILQTE